MQIVAKENEIKESFSRQGLMQLYRAELVEIAEGRVSIKCPYSKELTQQDGFFHAGVLTSLVDTACGYAAFTRMPEGANVLSIEFKVNFMRPAKGAYVTAVGEVLRAGRQITVCEGTVYDERDRAVAKMQATMITVEHLR